MPDVLPLCNPLDTHCTCGQATSRCKWRSQGTSFQKRDELCAFVFRTGKTKGENSSSQRRHPTVSQSARPSQGCQEKGQTQHSWSISGRRTISSTPAVRRCHRRRSQKKCDRLASGPKRDHVNVNFGEAHTTWSKQQQVEQTVWPPPSIPICQKQKSGIESIFVDEDAILPHNHRLPAASGKIGVVGNIGRIQVRHQKDCKGRKEGKHVLLQVLRSKDPYTHAHVLKTATQLRGRVRDLNEYSTVWGGRCR